MESLDCIKVLLDARHKCISKQQEGEQWTTPLMVACQNGNSFAVDMLLKNVARHAEEGTEIALSDLLAIWICQYSFMNIGTNNSSSSCTKNADGITGFVDRECGLAPVLTFRGNDGASALNIAVQHGRIDVVKRIIEVRLS